MSKIVSVIVVTYNNLEYTKECIEALRASTEDYELIMIDNGSTDGTKEFILTEISEYYFNNRNIGFAKAVNQGLKSAEGEYVLLLNNDVLINQNTMWNMINSFYAIKNNGINIGAIAPLARGIGGKQDYAHIYGELGYKQPYEDNYKIFISGNSFYREGDYTETKLLAGCCLLMNTELLRSMGGLDENMICGADDADLSVRLRLAGYRLFVAEDTFVHHYNHKTFELIGKDKELEFHDKSWDAFWDKWSHLGVSAETLLENEDKYYYDGKFNNKRSKASC